MRIHRPEHPIRLLALGFLALLVMSLKLHPLSASMTPLDVEATITFVQPDGSDDFVGEGEDFATQVWGDPWTFDSRYDLLQPAKLKNVDVSGGRLSATIKKSSDPHFYVLFPGVPSAINLNTGQQHPIDANVYHRVAFKFCTDSTSFGRHVRLYWYDGYTNGNVYHSGQIPVQTGCGIYIKDLEDHADWHGDITGLRIDLELFEVDDTFTLDWVRLTRDDGGTNTAPIAWTGLDPAGGTLELFLDDDTSGYDGDQIAAIANAQSTGSFEWGQVAAGLPLPEDFQPGVYYVYAKVNGQTAGYSTHPVVVSQAPILQFEHPSFTSGRDYATENGNSWDMDNSGSDGVVRGCTSYEFSGGELTARNDEGDPQLKLNTPVPIDTSYYRYFTIEFYSKYSFYDVRGGMSRVYWMNDVDHWTTTEDLIINVPLEWRTYSLDLSQVDVEPIGTQNAWTSDNWEILRFDPNENVTGVNWRWVVRDVKLTGPPEADTHIILRWAVDNPETESIDLEFFYDTNNRGFNGTAIGATTTQAQSAVRADTQSDLEPQADFFAYLPLVSYLTCSGNCYPWDTMSVDPGEYFIYACLDDGVNQICRYSDVPVLVTHD